MCDPVGFAREELLYTAWSKQREILEAVRDHPAVAVKACHGPGKTSCAAVAVLTFLDAFPGSRVITTAPTWHQVENLLWREIRSRLAKAHHAGRALSFPKPSATKLELGPDWFAIGQSTNEPERFQGHHAPHLLLIVDEASGVAEAIFEAAEGFRTTEGAHILLLGNPTQIGGQFHRAFTSESDRWHTISISVFDTPNYTGEDVPPEVAAALPKLGWAGEMERSWGVDSPVYQVRVLGEFPTNAADSVIPLSWVVAAQARWKAMDLGSLGPLRTIGVDVARSGTDRTVLAIRHDDAITELVRLPQQGTMDTANDVKYRLAAMSENPVEAPTAIVDVIGVGAGVVDRLRELKVQVVPFNASEKTDRMDKTYEVGFTNKRAAMYWNLREMLDPDGPFEICLPPDENLTGDLTTPKWQVMAGGRIQIESKDDIRKRLGRSTDDGDAVAMAFWPEGGITHMMNRFARDEHASFFAGAQSPSRWR